MGTATRLEASIKEHLTPILRADGFSGSGCTFRRVVGDFVQVVNVQGSRYGGRFSINLAVQPLCIPDVCGESPDPKKITEASCEFRRRLSASGPDQWWSHQDTQESLDEAVQLAASLYCSVGRQLLANFDSPTSPLHSVTAEVFQNGRYSLNGFGSTRARMALALARFRQAKGLTAEAKNFARIGLASVGSTASSIRRELEKIERSA